MKKQIGLALIVSILVTGCGSDIDKVKSSRSPFNDIYKIKDIFDTRKSCSKIDWTEFKSEKGINIIEYTCNVDMTDEISNHEKLIQRSKKEALDKYNEIQEINSKSLKEDQEMILKYKSELAKSVEEHGQLTNVSWDHDKYDIGQQQKQLQSMIYAYETSKKGAERFLNRNLEDLEKEAYNSNKSRFMYGPIRAQHKLVAQFTFIDDEKSPRILYTGEESITIDGEKLTKSIKAIEFFSDMEQDKPIVTK